MLMRMKGLGIVAAALTIVAAPGAVLAGTYFEGFEGSSYNIYPNPATATAASNLTTSQHHSGNQSLQMFTTKIPGSNPAQQDYTRVLLNLTSSPITLGQITDASYWVKRDSSSGDFNNPNISRVPYLIFSIQTPGHGPDDTLAVMWDLSPALATNNFDWTEVNVSTSTTRFHVEGDTTGISNSQNVYLDNLFTTQYSPGVMWGDLQVNYVRLGFGQDSAGQGPSTVYVDDLTINYRDGAVPEPSSVVSAGIAALVGLAYSRRRRANAAA